PRVQQVEHRVLDSTDVEVDDARVVGAVDLRTGARPVARVLQCTHLVGVGGDDVAQLVPARSRPLRHDVGVAGEGPATESVVQVQLDVEPVGGLGQRRGGDRVRVVGVEGDGLVVLHLGQLDGQHLV